MLRLPRFFPFAFVCVLACTLAATAQTYTPKTIRFDGVDGQDSAQLLQLAGWKTSVPLTKQEIEAGLQKLADTGSFTSISYTVDSAALVVKLVSTGSQQLPVRFTNFVWWTPADLERQVEARVPLFHGELTLTGSLTDQVEAALIAIAREKGLTVTVSAGNSSESGKRSIALSIEHPAIVFGNLNFADVNPAFGPTTADFKQGLAGQDFDLLLTASTIQHDAGDIYRNAGYLDAVVDAPVFAAPRSSAGGYAVDANAEVHPGDLYRVAALSIAAAAPLTESDLRKASELKSGDPASPMGILITGQKFALLYKSRGYLDTDAHTAATIDNVAHTASYAISMEPGEIYHLTAVDSAAAPAELQNALAHDAHLMPGVVADDQVQQDIRDTLRRLNMTRSIAIGFRPDHAAHTLTIVLRPAGPATPRG